MTYILTRYTPTQTQSSKLIAITYILHVMHLYKHYITIETVTYNLQEKTSTQTQLNRMKNHHTNTKLNFDILHFIV